MPSRVGENAADIDVMPVVSRYQSDLLPMLDRSRIFDASPCDDFGHFLVPALGRPRWVARRRSRRDCLAFVLVIGKYRDRAVRAAQDWVWAVVASKHGKRAHVVALIPNRLRTIIGLIFLPTSSRWYWVVLDELLLLSSPLKIFSNLHLNIDDF